MSKIRIAIVDDHRILRDGLKALVNEMPDMEVALEASDGKDFIDKLEKTTPDLVILDINMPIMSGPEAIIAAKKKYPDLKIIILTMHNDEETFKKLNELGVDGYLIKESDYEELNRAILTVLKGGKYFSQELLLQLLQTRQKSSSIILTKREKEILQLLCQGLSTQEIASRLFISNRTVEKHRSDLLLRTDSPNSISLVLYAIKNRLIDIA